MPPKNGNGNDNFAAALAEVSDRLTRLVQDEIELAKAEVAQKTKTLARGAAAVAAGAVFGIFAVVFLLLTLAWVLDGIFVSGAGSLWLGFLIVLVILVVLTIGAAMFAWRSFSVGAPTPTMAIDEGRKIKTTVTTLGGSGNGHKTKPAEDYVSEPFAAAVAAAAAARPTVVIEPTPVQPKSQAPSVASGEEPTFVSVPDPEIPTTEQPAAGPGQAAEPPPADPDESTGPES